MARLALVQKAASSSSRSAWATSKTGRLPIHYDTFDVIRQDARAWKERVERETGAQVALLKPGETLQLQ